MNVVLILVLGGLMHAVCSFRAEPSPQGGTTLAFGYLLLTAYFVGALAKQARLPKLTGYLAAGILVGPSALGLLTEAMVENLTLVNGVAVALIALTAGTELELRSMRPLMRSIAAITLFAVIGTIFVLAAVVFATRAWLPFMAELSTVRALAVALVLGVVIAAQSPAVVVALRNEMQADGPVAKTVLGVVVIADLVVIVLFGITSSLAKSALGGRADVMGVLAALGWELLGSLVVGAALGFVLALYLRKVKVGAALFLLTVVFVMAEVGVRLRFDPLLLALAAGLLIRNATDVGDELHRQIEASSLPVYVLFFAVAGATLHVDALVLVGLPAFAYALTRAGGFLVGARVGARIARSPEAVRRYAGYGLLPQAGLALALSLLFAKTFPELGSHSSALVLAVVAINELIAPVLYRLALVKSGEAGRLAPPPALDEIAPSPAHVE